MNTSKLHELATEVIAGHADGSSVPVWTIQAKLAQGLLDVLEVNKKLSVERMGMIGQLHAKDEKIKELRKRMGLSLGLKPALIDGPPGPDTNRATAEAEIMSAFNWRK